jgi:hypothetical protein
MFGQASNAPQQIILGASGPGGVGNVGLTVVGNQGNVTSYYWVVPNFPIGMGMLSQQAVVINSPGVLSGSNYVRVNWAPVAGATGYWVLKTLSPNLPGTCTCLLTGPSNISSYNDTGGALTSFSHIPIGPTTATIFLDNENYSVPTLIVNPPFPGGGSTIPAVTNIIMGNGAGNGADSGIAPGNVATAGANFTNLGLVYGGGANKTLLSSADWTVNTHTLTAGALAVFDISSAAATGFRVPVVARATPTAAGQVAYDSTGNVYVGFNGTLKKTFAFIDSNITGNTTGNAATATALGLVGGYTYVWMDQGVCPTAAAVTAAGYDYALCTESGILYQRASNGNGGLKIAVRDGGAAATATALGSLPTLCPTGQAPTGVVANGNATGCAVIGGGGGSGTVTVVGSGNLTSTALVTGGGSQALQTPAATATMDSSGNISTPGGISLGVGGSVGGHDGVGAGTPVAAAAGIVGWQAPAVVSTPYYMNLPPAPTTGFLLNTGTTDPSIISFVLGSGTGNVCLTTNCVMTTPALGTPSAAVLTNATGLPEGGLTLTNIATNDVSITKHGFAPILPNDSTKFLNGVGGYTVPPGGGGGGGWLGYSGAGLTISGTQYFPVTGGGLPSATETDVDLPAPSASTIANFYVETNVAVGSGTTVVFTFRKAGAGTTSTCTLSGTGAGGTKCNDTTHSFTTASGDLITVQSVVTGTPIVGTLNVMFGYSVGTSNVGITSIFGSTGPVVGAIGDIGATGVINTIKGGAVPTTAKVLGTNGSGQPIAATGSNISDVGYAAGGGSANVQTATYTPANAALTAGLRLCWLPTAANSTTTPTFAPDGLTAHTIVKAGGALIASDIITTAVACAVYDTTGTQWELQNPQTVAAGGSSCTLLGASGDWLVPGGSFSIGAYNGTSGITHIGVANGGNANTPNAIRVFIPCAFTPNKIGFQITTAGGAGCKIEVGLYNAAGTLVIHSGVLTDSTTVTCNSTGEKYLTSATTPAATGMGTSYAAGWYWVVTTDNGVNTQMTAMPLPSAAGEPGLLLRSATTMGGTAAVTTLGALNGSIGTVTNAAVQVPLLVLTN